MKTLTFILLLFVIGCTSVRRPPEVDGSLTASSQYNFRGVPQNDRGVLQPEVGITVPISSDANAGFAVWGNLDVGDDTGGAIFPDGNGGRLSEIDFTGSISRQLGSTDLSVGVISYNFPNGVGSSTTELHTMIAWELFGFTPTLAAFYDFDAVDGLYINGGLSRSNRVTNNLSVELGLSAGFTDRDHALTYYGSGSAGAADLFGTANVSYLYNDAVTASVSLSGSTLIKDELRDAVDREGIDSDNLWIGLNLGWKF